MVDEDLEFEQEEQNFTKLNMTYRVPSAWKNLMQWVLIDLQKLEITIFVQSDFVGEIIRVTLIWNKKTKKRVRDHLKLTHFFLKNLRFAHYFGASFPLSDKN